MSIIYIYIYIHLKIILLNSLLLTQFIFADFKGIFYGKKCPGISYKYLCSVEGGDIENVGCVSISSLAFQVMNQNIVYTNSGTGKDHGSLHIGTLSTLFPQT